ncbi:MAG: hypothetical protein KC421_10715 [Anaerolineales bacterium]|nr:hypothetical protein [Anaerolineales bacterium]
METIRSLFLMLIVFLILGALFSLPMLLPPLRKWARRSRTNRQISSITFGILTFVILFFGVTWLIFEVSFAIGVEWATYQGESFDNGGGRFYDEALREAFMESKTAIRREFWLRSLSVPSANPLCYTDDPEVCALVDDLESLGGSDISFQFSMLTYLIFLLIPAFFTGYLVQLYTRPNM